MSMSIDFEPVNALDYPAFIHAFGSVFEHFPQAAEDAWTQRPFVSAQALHAAMMNVIRTLDAYRQRDFLNLHPLLSGANICLGTMTADSNAEQMSAGLDAMSHDQEAALDALNAAYLKRHAFPSSSACGITRARAFSVRSRGVSNAARMKNWTKCLRRLRRARVAA